MLPDVHTRGLPALAAFSCLAALCGVISLTLEQWIILREKSEDCLYAIPHATTVFWPNRFTTAPIFGKMRKVAQQVFFVLKRWFKIQFPNSYAGNMLPLAKEKYIT